MTTSMDQKAYYQNQPGTVLKMQAKAGKGDELFELTNSLHYIGDPDGPVDWALCRSDEDPDTLWAFEFYKDDASFIRHFSDNTVDDRHEQVIALLGDMPLRVDVKIVAAGMNDTSNGKRPFYQNQPGMALRMPAKKGQGKALFDLAINAHQLTDPDGPTDWVLCQPVDDPDLLWGFEFYQDDASFTRHYADPAVEKEHQSFGQFLASDQKDEFLRVNVHIESSSTDGSTDQR